MTLITFEGYAQAHNEEVLLYGDKELSMILLLHNLGQGIKCVFKGWSGEMLNEYNFFRMFPYGDKLII